MLYFKFTQSSHAVIFCTAVFVLRVSSHVVISRAFQGPPLKVRAHNTTSAKPPPPPLLISDVNQATKPPQASSFVFIFFWPGPVSLFLIFPSLVFRQHIFFTACCEYGGESVQGGTFPPFIDGVRARLSAVYFSLMQSVVMDDGLHFIRSLALIPPRDQGGFCMTPGRADPLKLQC